MTESSKLPAELDMTNAADVEWVRSRNDPAIWHEAAIAAVAYRGDKHGFLPWLIQQPNMDRATAGWLLFWLQGSKYLQGQKDSFWAKIYDNDAVSLLDSLCQRSEKIGFIEDSIGLDGGFEKERQACLAVIEDGLLATEITVPHAIIAKSFKSPSGTQPYEIHDGTLLSIDFLRDSMPELYS
ncbi:hypothetical protein ACYQR9_17185 [Methylobacterium sp. CM6241]